MKSASFINEFCGGARKLRVSSTVAGLLCLGAFFSSDLRSAAAVVPGGGVTKTDRTFANEAATGLLRDMRMAAIAAEESERTEVKEFARAVLDHRTKAHAQLRTLAGRTRLVLPDQMGAHQQMQVEKLQKLKGRALGRQFLNYIAQTDYLHFFGLELSNGALQTNPEVQAFAKTQQSIIRGDMERAQKLLQQDR